MQTGSIGQYEISSLEIYDQSQIPWIDLNLYIIQVIALVVVRSFFCFSYIVCRNILHLRLGLDKLAKLSKRLFLNMPEEEVFAKIRGALNNAPRNQYTSELHLQMIKYSDLLKTITAKEFCKGVGLKSSFGTEFSKMRNLTDRLKKAGLNTELI